MSRRTVTVEPVTDDAGARWYGVIAQGDVLVTAMFRDEALAVAYATGLSADDGQAGRG